MDFDETLDVVRQVFDGQHVTIEVYWHRGPVPFAGCTGWLNELRISEKGLWIRLGTEPVGTHKSAQARAGFLIVSRAGFLGAGEFASEPPGPLLIQTEQYDAVIGGSLVPDWDQLQRPDRTTPETRA